MCKKKSQIPDEYSIRPSGCRLRRPKSRKALDLGLVTYDAFADPEFLKKLPEEMVRNEERLTPRRKALEEMSQLTAKDLYTMVY